MSAALTNRAASNKRVTNDNFFIPRLPAPPRRTFGSWEAFDVEPKEIPDDDGEGDATHLAPHHRSLKNYWGDVDDDSVIRLFHEPTIDYQPLKLDSSNVMFKDNEYVSIYLINFLHIFI